MQHLTKTLRDGRVVTITRDALGAHVARLADGTVLSRGDLQRHPNPPAPGLTHRIGRLCLTDEEATAAGRLAPEEMPAAAPALPDQRAALVRALNAALDEDTVRQGRAQDTDTADRYYRIDRPVSVAAIEQARDTLAAFDRAHPEVLVAAQEQEAADVQRWAAI